MVSGCVQSVCQWKAEWYQGVFSQSVSGGLNGIRGAQSVSGGLNGIRGCSVSQSVEG
jgi:hypothetical protein